MVAAAVVRDMVMGSAGMNGEGFGNHGLGEERPAPAAARSVK